MLPSAPDMWRVWCDIAAKNWTSLFDQQAYILFRSNNFELHNVVYYTTLASFSTLVVMINTNIEIYVTAKFQVIKQIRLKEEKD